MCQNIHKRILWVKFIRKYQIFSSAFLRHTKFSVSIPLNFIEMQHFYHKSENREKILKYIRSSSIAMTLVNNQSELRLSISIVLQDIKECYITPVCFQAFFFLKEPLYNQRILLKKYRRKTQLLLCDFNFFLYIYNLNISIMEYVYQ